MKQLLFLLGMICVLSIEARNVQETQFDSTSEDAEDNAFLRRIKDQTSQMRHKRRSRQSHYDYWNPYQYDSFRRDYDRRQDELLTQILKQLDELSTYVRHPPPSAPPVYVPYPVLYAVPQYRSCVCKNATQTPESFDDRLPTMEDENQNWGPVIEEGSEDYFSPDDDGARPIVLKPPASLRPNNKQPPLEHGSSQAGAQTTTTRAPPVKGPGTCQAAILSCCKSEQKQACFARYGCQRTFRSGNACNPDVIKRVILQFSETYAPSDE